jgi:hypothetical protein
MASWEDGPEYAPALRPDHFAEPPAAPLSAVPPAAPSSPPAPIERPAFDQPPVPVPPLASLVPPIEDTRDPALPFDIASATLTEASAAWSAAHWSPPTGPAQPVTGVVANGSAALPGTPLALPPSPPPGPFPGPGTEQWFQPAPPPYAPAPPPAGTGPGAIAQALTLGVVICLAIGGIVWPLAPIMFLVAFGLASRVKVGRPAVLGLFAAVLAILFLVGVVGALLSDGFFSDWWELVARWAQVLCWLVLVAGWIAVWRALRSAGPRSAPPPNVWG